MMSCSFRELQVRFDERNRKQVPFCWTQRGACCTLLHCHTNMEEPERLNLRTRYLGVGTLHHACRAAGWTPHAR